jgi:hypothetical protein
VIAGGMIYLLAIAVTAFSRESIRRMDGGTLQGQEPAMPPSQPLATR